MQPLLWSLVMADIQYRLTKQATNSSIHPYSNLKLFQVFSLLDKVMSRNQWHIGVQERHLLFKGPMQLKHNVLVSRILCNVILHNDLYLSPYLVTDTWFPPEVVEFWFYLNKIARLENVPKILEEKMSVTLTSHQFITSNYHQR